MTENVLCNRLRNIVLDSQNALQPIRTSIHNARSDVQNALRQIENLDNELQSAQLSSRITGTAGRLFGGVGGAIVNGLGATEAAIKVSRLESEIRVERYNLERTRGSLKELEQESENYQESISRSQTEMRQRNCDN